MRNYEIAMNPNPLVRYLKKPASEFKREDIMRYIEENNIQMLNFRYIGDDGKLKTLNFVITSKDYLDSVFATGERVDGSSLFSYIEASSSDLYVIPRFKTAFLNPFSEIPAMDIFCSFYTKNGEPLPSAPENILRKAQREFTKTTGFDFKAMGELEYYIISPKNTMYPTPPQKGYHNSAPFGKWEALRTEAMHLIAQCGGKIKYGHSEVGCFSTETDDFEQHEIEFNPVDVVDAADQIVLAKWVLRNLGLKYGVNISFAPKIVTGKAGSGLHIHMLLEKNGENIMIENDQLSNVCRKMIAGLLRLSLPLTAFGNTIPTSYLRLVPHQEAPTYVCWGETNRSGLVRVPLGWVAKTSMVKDANPHETGDIPYIPGKQTIEFRVPDGSADIYHLLAGIIVAAQLGLTMENSLDYAEKLKVTVNIFKDENKHLLQSLEKLPTNCSESADYLIKFRDYFEKNEVFPAGTIDRFVKQLKSYDDEELSERLYGRPDEIRRLLDKYMHVM